MRKIGCLKAESILTSDYIGVNGIVCRVDGVALTRSGVTIKTKEFGDIEYNYCDEVPVFN